MWINIWLVSIITTNSLSITDKKRLTTVKHRMSETAVRYVPMTDDGRYYLTKISCQIGEFQIN